MFAKPFPLNRGLVAAALVAGCFVLGGCNVHAARQHSQVVATVNDHELTLLQLNQALQANGAEATPENTRLAIASLIDEELLVQQAVKSSLERDPAVVQAIEHARRRVLVEAYTERMVFPKQDVPLAEMEEYYRSNPALFEHRRIYRLTAFTIVSTDMNDRLSADLDAAHSEDAVRGVLERHEIKFTTQPINSAAEELPLDKLDAFAKAKAGDLIVAEQRDGSILLMSVAGVEDRPLTFEHAKPMIAQYLTAVRNTKAADTYLKGLKETAKISYAPRFSQEAQNGPDATRADSGSSVSTARAEKPAGVTGLN
jgi:EpsD family peptidyl-prolyl cis-trans isomerase